MYKYVCKHNIVAKSLLKALLGGHVTGHGYGKSNWWAHVPDAGEVVPGPGAALAPVGLATSVTALYAMTRPSLDTMTRLRMTDRELRSKGIPSRGSPLPNRHSVTP